MPSMIFLTFSFFLSCWMYRSRSPSFSCYFDSLFVMCYLLCRSNVLVFASLNVFRWMPHDLLWHRLRFLIHGTSCIALKDSLWFLDGYTAPHYPKLHYTALRWATSHYTTKHHHNAIPGTPHYIALHCATLRWSTLHDTTPQHHNTPQIHYTALHYMTLHHTTRLYTTLHHT